MPKIEPETRIIKLARIFEPFSFCIYLCFPAEIEQIWALQWAVYLKSIFLKTVTAFLLIVVAR